MILPLPCFVCSDGITLMISSGVNNTVLHISHLSHHCLDLPANRGVILFFLRWSKHKNNHTAENFTGTELNFSLELGMSDNIGL